MAGKGRPFQKGNPGKPKGAKNRLPRGFKASVKAIFEELGAEHRGEWVGSIRRAMKQGGNVGFRYIEIAAAYLDGRPVQRVSLETPQTLIIDFGKDREAAGEKGTKDPETAEPTEEVAAQGPPCAHAPGPCAEKCLLTGGGAVLLYSIACDRNR